MWKPLLPWVNKIPVWEKYPQDSQTLIRETPPLSVKCPYRRHALHPQSAKDHCGRHSPIPPSAQAHDVGWGCTDRVLQGGAPGVG